jgi:hypothetical protein
MRRTSTLALPGLSDLLAARSPGHVSVILDLLRDDDSGEPGREGADILSEAARSLRAAERGYSVLAAIRPAADAAGRMGFTRLTMPPLDEDGGPASGEALLAAMYERASANDPNGDGAQSFVFLRGAADPTIDGLVARATHAREWPRVVELRLDRAQTLATVGQRVQELSGVARILQVELRDPNGAVDVLEQARALAPTRVTVLEALKRAYEASGRAPPIDPAEYAKAFATHWRARQTDAALLDAMVLEELGVAEPEHEALVERSRSVTPVQVLKALDAAAWEALRAPGFDEVLSALLAAVHDAAVAVRVEQMKSSRRPPSLDSRARLADDSTVSAVRTLHWAARVLGVSCPDLYVGAEDGGDVITQVPGKGPSISLGPGVLSGMSSKQLAFLAGSCLTWHRPEYHSLLYYPALDDLRELVRDTLEIAGPDGPSSGPSNRPAGELRRGLARHLRAEDQAAIGEAAGRLRARGGEVELDHWIRSAELTAARAGLFLCGELKTAVAAVRSQPRPPGRPSAERVTSDLVTFCASQAHAQLRSRFLTLG